MKSSKWWVMTLSAERSSLYTHVVYLREINWITIDCSGTYCIHLINLWRRIMSWFTFITVSIQRINHRSSGCGRRWRRSIVATRRTWRISTSSIRQILFEFYGSCLNPLSGKWPLHVSPLAQWFIKLASLVYGCWITCNSKDRRLFSLFSLSRSLALSITCRVHPRTLLYQCCEQRASSHSHTSINRQQWEKKKTNNMTYNPLCAHIIFIFILWIHYSYKKCTSFSLPRNGVTEE